MKDVAAAPQARQNRSESGWRPNKRRAASLPPSMFYLGASLFTVGLPICVKMGRDPQMHPLVCPCRYSIIEAPSGWSETLSN